MTPARNAWLPAATCGVDCLDAGALSPGRRVAVGARVALRATLTVLLLPTLPLLAVPLPGRTRVQRSYCRLVLRCLGIRIAVSGGPIRNVPGVLVVSGHVSWVDIFAIGAVMPGAFVAKAEMVGWRGWGTLARMLKVIPIERDNLRRLPEVVAAVADRLRAGRTVVAFPEGTTWCGLGYGPFRPAMFQSAIDAGRPVQPLRLSYHHRDGSRSTAAAYIGDDSLLTSIRRLVTARRTVVHVYVDSLQLPGTDRRELAARCEAAVRGVTDAAGAARARRGEGHALAA
ncbi:lysophospholipid acyltransferase family protein [Mycobacterium sp. ITM-2016-00317]|uniref:lysophospholipid acyltransferase family protein n=1 Tax=Mycobacterium sp. ITM-2016-00317 TaxID=2099694 RepID=UPI000D3F2781|nr:lysophospholipid acyltransferase family protein [Mycobacterium sp. ITM-2016-00317]WNG89412.1 lysophospholipid acyltransferase family protein [Mycobacterium sp. ITM-2016-00317]